MVHDNTWKKQAYAATLCPSGEKPGSRFLLVLLLLCLTGGRGRAQEAARDTVTIGAYINSIYDVKLNDGCFTTDTWVWFLYRNRELKPLETTEFPNTKEISSGYKSSEEKGGVLWSTMKVKAVVKMSWNIQNYPFDRQVLRIWMEESEMDNTAMVYRPDAVNTMYDSTIKLTGWNIIDFGIETTDVNYPTTYGDPELATGSTYSRAVIRFVLERDGLGLFIKLFTGLYIAFAISLLVFFIDPKDIDPRFGFSVGGMFGAITNKYIVDAILPDTTTFTLVDIIHDITFLFMLISIGLSIISLYYAKRRKRMISQKIDRIGFWSLAGLYIVLNVVVIVISMD